VKKVLRNQTHPTESCRGEEPATPCLSRPSDQGEVLCLADAQDEFQVLIQLEWVARADFWTSRGWIRGQVWNCRRGASGSAQPGCHVLCKEKNKRKKKKRKNKKKEGSKEKKKKKKKKREKKKKKGSPGMGGGGWSPLRPFTPPIFRRQRPQRLDQRLPWRRTRPFRLARQEVNTSRDGAPLRERPGEDSCRSLRRPLRPPVLARNGILAGYF